METTYTPWLVVLSIAVAIVVPYTSLGLATRVAKARGITGRVWLVLGACSMGIGIWAMHFIGMLALSMPIQLTYDVGTIVASLGIAIATSGFAICSCSSETLGPVRHIICSLVLGLGIAGLHYTGMHALLIVPGLRYALVPMLASVLIAIAASWVALWLSFFMRDREFRHTRLARLAAAVVMGGAVAGMHYMGLAAMIIAPNAICRGGVQLDNGWFAVAIAVAALGILVINSLVSLFDAHLAARERMYAASLAQADRELLHQARHDTLTGLPNRSCFLDCLREAMQRVDRGEQSTLAVLFLDLDRFKFVNDTQGHGAGDELLRQIADRLRTCIQTADLQAGSQQASVISRFGGDEFLVLLNCLRHAWDAEGIAARMQSILEPAYEIQGQEVHCSASIGIVANLKDVTCADDVIRNADVALYEAKRAGRARAVQFSPAMQDRVSRQVMIESDLRRAIGTSELQVYYQPIVDLDTGCLASVEALVRWQHPSLGWIQPAEFIPIAEDSDLIGALDQWVRVQACRAMKLWHLTEPKLAPATVSVNVSSVELARGNEFLWGISELLDSARLPPSRLQIEVTESNVMHNPEATLKLMHDLRARGVRIAMDDFGTGASSLSLLRTYPFDTVKIDRSFVVGLVDDTDVRTVIHATIGLVERLGMSSLVEGIENQAQLSLLCSMGCGLGQGWLFSPAVPAGEVMTVARRLRAGTHVFLEQTRRSARLKLG